MRTLPLTTTMSPHWTSAQVEAQVPTRMKVSAPHLWSSSTQMAVEGPPIPVEVTVTRSPSSVPSQVVNSRFRVTMRGLSRWAAISSHRSGSPGTMA